MIGILRQLKSTEREISRTGTQRDMLASLMGEKILSNSFELSECAVDLSLSFS